MFLFILGASGRQMLIHCNWGHVDTAEVSLLSAMCVLHHMDNQIIVICSVTAGADLGFIKGGG